MSQDYVNWYASHVPCDFCGAQTRGRIYNETNYVICGSCKNVLVDNILEDRNSAADEPA